MIPYIGAIAGMAYLALRKQKHGPTIAHIRMRQRRAERLTKARMRRARRKAYEEACKLRLKTGSLGHLPDKASLTRFAQKKAMWLAVHVPPDESCITILRRFQPRPEPPTLARLRFDDAPDSTEEKRRELRVYPRPEPAESSLLRILQRFRALSALSPP